MSDYAIRPAAMGDLAALGVVRGEVREGGLLTALSPARWTRVLEQYARDAASIFLVAADSSGPVAYALSTPQSLAVQRRVVLTSPGIWLDLGRYVIRHPSLIAPVARRAFRLAQPSRSAGNGDREQASAVVDPLLRLLDIVVSERVRGHGIGRALLAETLLIAERRGYREIGLSVLSSNVAAIRLYGSGGFSVMASGVRGDGKAFLTMRRELPGPTR